VTNLMEMTTTRKHRRRALVWRARRARIHCCLVHKCGTYRSEPLALSLHPARESVECLQGNQCNECLSSTSIHHDQSPRNEPPPAYTPEDLFRACSGRSSSQCQTSRPQAAGSIRGNIPNQYNTRLFEDHTYLHGQ
jgi:hypothetical protein